MTIFDYDLTINPLLPYSLHRQPMYSSKAPKGTVDIEVFQGRLRLRLPRQLFGGKQKYLTLGLPDTDFNRKAAAAKAKLIESDIALERFDPTLEKYGKTPLPQLTIAQQSMPQSISVIYILKQLI